VLDAQFTLFYNLLLKWCGLFFTNISNVVLFLINDIDSIELAEVLMRFLLIGLCILIIRNTKYKRFRYFAHYFSIYALLTVLLIVFYNFFANYQCASKILSLWDLFFSLMVFRVYCLRIAIVGLSLQDWSIGIPIRTQFANDIYRVFSNALLGINCVAVANKAFIMAKASNIVITILFFAPFYLYLSWFAYIYQKDIQQEIAEIVPDFILDRTMLLAIYGSLFFLFLLNIVDTGIEDRFARIALTVFLLVSFFAVIDVYLKVMLVHIWGKFSNVQYNYSYTELLWVLRFLWSIVFLYTLQFLWNVSKTAPIMNFAISIASFVIPLSIIWLVADLVQVLFALRITPTDLNSNQFSFANLKQRAVTLFAAFKSFMTWIKAMLIVGFCLVSTGADIGSVLNNVAWVLAGMFYVGQSEFQNFFTGVALVIEDAINLGDLIKVNEKILGIIEHIGLRSMKIRALDGSVFFIPFGKILILENKSRDFSFVLLNISVKPNTEIAKISDSIDSAVKEIEPSMHTIGVYLGAIEHRGVVDISGEKLVYQSRIKCSPGQQYTVKRALNAALKVILDKNNIVIPSQINLSTETMSMSNSEFKNMV